MYALVDCNNFYVSVERMFNPGLEGKAVIVLSNNDGCAIARSEEAKILGVDMGTPGFLLQELISQGRLIDYSSNYTLYGDISDRVMRTLESFVPQMEIYSIDEAFLDMSELPYQDLLRLGMKIRNTVKQHLGLPVSVGIGATKTLAKMANRYAKKKCRDTGVHWAANDHLTTEMLRETAVEDIWGIGRQRAAFLLRNGFKTALDLRSAPEDWIRKHFTVTGLRLLSELKGIPVIEWKLEPEEKQNICTSRSFGKLQTDKKVIKEALVNYAASCAEKLRSQKSCCRKLNVSIQTNPHKVEHRQYFRSITVELEIPSNQTGDIIKYALKGLDIIFQTGYQYLKCGVVVMDLVPEEKTQGSLFSNVNPKAAKLMAAMDGVNAALGKETVRMAVQGFKKTYRMKSAHLSPCYTTNVNQLLKIKI